MFLLKPCQFFWLNAYRSFGRDLPKKVLLVKKRGWLHSFERPPRPPPRAVCLALGGCAWPRPLPSCHGSWSVKRRSAGALVVH